MPVAKFEPSTSQILVWSRYRYPNPLNRSAEYWKEVLLYEVGLWQRYGTSLLRACHGTRRHADSSEPECKRRAPAATSPTQLCDVLPEQAQPYVLWETPSGLSQR